MTTARTFHICGRLATATTYLLDSLVSGEPCHVAALSLLHTGELDLDIRVEIRGNAMTREDLSGITVSWAVMYGPGEVNVAALRKDVEVGGKLHELIRRVVAGHRVDWRNPACLGTLSEDAMEARHALERHFEMECYSTGKEVRDAAEWLWGSGIEGLTGETTDGELYALMESVERRAESEDVLLMDLEDALRRWRDDLREIESCRVEDQE